jgi:Zn-dependent protease with chaperone function
MKAMRVSVCALTCAGLLVVFGDAQEAPPRSAEAMADLLAKEPVSDATWPAWRARLEAWLGDKSKAPDAAYYAAAEFLHGKRDANGDLPDPYAKDHFAWYILSLHFPRDVKGPQEREAAFTKIEAALKRSLALQPNFARAHRNLASVHLSRVRGPTDLNLQLAERELAEARRLDPKVPMAILEGGVALFRQKYHQAETKFREALADDPEDRDAALGLVQAVIGNPNNRGVMAQRVATIIEPFPDDGLMVAFHALALAGDGRFRESRKELEHARALGVEPSTVFPPDLIDQIETAARPGWLEQGAWVMFYFAVAYAVIMLVMAGAGVVLASRTRGTGALALLSASPDELVQGGHVARGQEETALARLYGLVLVVGLVLFYVAVPFVIAGLIWLTCLALYGMFQLGRISVQLVLMVAVAGFFGAWSVFRALFAKPASGAFGVPKDAGQCPKVHALLAEVAQRVDTDPVDEVYIAPGSAIGVHQEGRGPFGVFGVKRRVLTLGLSTMRFLTVAELKSILAHEYAHFSHSDTLYSRFIYQVHMSIAAALDGMGAAGGFLTYVNPFYWFMLLYYKCYSLLSAGFSRSREFLADRMAVMLYGSDVFASALRKVATDGTLFEMTIYENISKLLQEQKSFINMYEAFRSFRDEHMPQHEREELYQKLLGEHGSLFASHPTFGERLEAIADLPKSTETDSRPALALFDNPDEIEQELTQFLTNYVIYMEELQAQAAAQAQGY